MALLDWSSAFSVGIDEIDEDHKKLIGMVNGLDEAIAKGKTHKVVEEILEELLEYTGWHFRHEERLMQTYGDPTLFEHKKEHEELVEQAVALYKLYHDGDDGVTDKLLPFLKEWLTHHILVVDKKTGDFLCSQ